MKSLNNLDSMLARRARWHAPFVDNRKNTLAMNVGIFFASLFALIAIAALVMLIQHLCRWLCYGRRAKLEANARQDEENIHMANIVEDGSSRMGSSETPETYLIRTRYSSKPLQDDLPERTYQVDVGRRNSSAEYGKNAPIANLPQI
jgi:hypothetical protein